MKLFPICFKMGQLKMFYSKLFLKRLFSLKFVPTQDSNWQTFAYEVNVSAIKAENTNLFNQANKCVLI